MKKHIILWIGLFFTSAIFAQKVAPENWFNLDYKTNKVHGVSTEKTYTELLKNKKPKPVIVAVIDGGTEVAHEDLKDVIWFNKKDKANNNLDDDNNGYVDDENGWSFIGGKDTNVVEDTYEYTRIYGKYVNKFEDKDGNTINQDMPEYTMFIKAKKLYIQNYKQAEAQLKNMDALLESMKSLINNHATTNFKNFKPTNNTDKLALRLAKIVNKTGGVEKSPIMDQIDGAKDYYKKQLKFYLNPDFNTRLIVGDNYEDINQRIYGSNYVSGPKGEHGTHVAGIIAANRNNDLGIKGVCDAAQIMVLRVVPDGDERDKDIANAIRYAADNGAKIINMSFGKAISPNKQLVDEAVKYALGKDVLLVHAAGNDAKNIDVEDNYPNARFAEINFIAPNWLEVGASSWKKKKYITADFSNYGKNKVDVFAPGVDITSCIPESKYAAFSGTSMAAPVTAGVAALLRAYYPNLTATQTRDIIMQSAVVYKKKVLIPGTKDKVKLTELCKTGGIVNAYQAVLLAEAMQAVK